MYGYLIPATQVSKSMPISLLSRLPKFWYIQGSLILAAVQLSPQLIHLCRVPREVKKPEFVYHKYESISFSWFKNKQWKTGIFPHAKKICSYMEMSKGTSFFQSDCFQKHSRDTSETNLEMHYLYGHSVKGSVLYHCV